MRGNEFDGGGELGEEVEEEEDTRSMLKKSSKEDGKLNEGGVSTSILSLSVLCV